MTTTTIDHSITPIADPAPRRASLIAGISYLALFFLAIFANFVVLGGMLVVDDAAATFANISESPATFRLGLLAFLAVFILDVAIAWALWDLFKRVSRELSRIAAWFRVVYTVFLGVALIFFFTVLQLVSGTEWLGAAFDQGQLEAQTMLALDAFNAAWLIGLAAFGVHLILIGTLIVRSSVAPRMLGILLAVAGAAYIVDTVAHGVLANYDDFANAFLAMVAVPSVIGELWFTFWLLSRGGKDTSMVPTG